MTTRPDWLWLAASRPRPLDEMVLERLLEMLGEVPTADDDTLTRLHAESVTLFDWWENGAMPAQPFASSRSVTAAQVRTIVTGVIGMVRRGMARS